MGNYGHSSVIKSWILPHFLLCQLCPSLARISTGILPRLLVHMHQAINLTEAVGHAPKRAEERLLQSDLLAYFPFPFLLLGRSFDMLRVRQILVSVTDLIVYLLLFLPGLLRLLGRILRSISWSNLLLNQLLFLIDTLEHLTIHLPLIDDICRAHDDTLQTRMLLCVRLKLQQTLFTI